MTKEQLYITQYTEITYIAPFPMYGHTDKAQMKPTMLTLRTKRVKGCLVVRSVVVLRTAIKEESQNHLLYVAPVDLQVSKYFNNAVKHNS